MHGLRRAFELAGARSIVMSLWKVDDEATQVLMNNFYANLIAGEAPASALRAAQLELRTQYEEPYFWAAFICQGAP